MVIFSLAFIFLMAVTLLLLMAVNKAVKNQEARAKADRWILLAVSFLFAAYADLRFALILGLLCLITWAAAGRKKLWCLGVVAALAGLGYFKYTNFFLGSFQRLLGREPTVLRLILPLGISFYTFSAISYLVDVHRGKLSRQSLSATALYLSFFPKLTSGPIMRSGDFFSQMEKPRQIGWASITAGAQIFVFGMFKKLVLADHLSVFVGQVFETPKAFSGLTVLLAVLSYSLQIYLDFSGYSDMAIGAARMLDVRLPRNFDLPYLSHNVTEFWKRWHITLSSWLQDYLYIPLGGSRKGKLRSYLNLVLTMVIGGLWHGPSWNYVIWGLLHGLALVVHKLWCSRGGEKKYTPLTSLLSIALTFLYVSFTWVFFRADTTARAMDILSAIFTWQDGLFQPYFWLFVSLAVCLISAALAVWHSRSRKGMQKKPNTSYVSAFYPVFDLDRFWALTLFLMVCGLILGLAYTGGSPFIYGGY